MTLPHSKARDKSLFNHCFAALMRVVFTGNNPRRDTVPTGEFALRCRSIAVMPARLVGGDFFVQHANRVSSLPTLTVSVPSHLKTERGWRSVPAGTRSSPSCASMLHINNLCWFNQRVGGKVIHFNQLSPPSKVFTRRPCCVTRVAYPE